MTDTVYDPATEGLPRFDIRETRDRRALDAALSDDRAYSAYALAYMERELFLRARFWLAEGPTGNALVLHAGAMGQTLFVSGDATAIDAVLSLHPGPRFTYVTTAAPEHISTLKRTYALSEPLEMMRMSVTRASFETVEGATRRLRGSDVRELNSLYSLERAGYYSAEHVEGGVYYGISREGRMVAVAGTHIVAPNIGVAVVGNVFTHPSYRGQGLATRVTSRVTADLLDRGCSLIALTVDPANTPAVRAYLRLGYERGPAVVEARARRRDLLGLGAWLRRRTSPRHERRGETEQRATGRPPAHEQDRGPDDGSA